MSKCLCVLTQKNNVFVKEKEEYQDTQKSMEVSFPDERCLFAFALIVCFDAVWFSVSARVYPPDIGKDARLAYGILAWACIALALACGRPESVAHAAAFGAAFGALAYGTFNGTEAAIRPDWRSPLTMVADTAWGACVCAAVSSLSFLLMDLASRQPGWPLLVAAVVDTLLVAGIVARDFKS